MNDHGRARLVLVWVAVFGLATSVIVSVILSRSGAAPKSTAPGSSASNAAPASDCSSGDDNCSIGKPPDPPVVEVPPASRPKAPAAADPAAARQQLDAVLKSPKFQQVLARQVHTQLEEIDAALHLDEAQKTKLAALLDRQAKAGVAMGAAVLGGGDAAGGSDDVYAIQREIEDVLTPEQRARYEEYRRTKTAQVRERQKQAEESSLIGTLGLDASQRPEVEKLVAASSVGTSLAIGDAEREALIGGHTDNDQRSAAFHKMLAKDVEDPALTSQLRGVLEPEQFAKYQQYIARKRAERERLRAMLANPSTALPTPRPAPSAAPAP